MKLLVISQYFYPEQFRVSDVCFRLASLGHDITVLTGLPNYPSGNTFSGYEWNLIKKAASENIQGEYLSNLKIYKEVINGVTVLRCKLYPRGKGKLNLMRNYISFVYHSVKASRALINSHFDFDKIVVFQYSPVTMAIPGILLQKKLQKPLFLYCFDIWPESIISAGLQAHGLFYHLVSKLSKWIYNKADIILNSSQNFEKYFFEKLNIKKEMRYLPIYAEDLFIKETPIEEGINIYSEFTNLVFAGNVGEMQSIDTIIKAADLLKDQIDIHFHIVGGGSALNKSIRLATNLNLNNITFHGHHTLEEMPTYYAIADAFLVTLKKSSFISYTLPGKVQTYMASGKPIIGAIDGETSDIIKKASCGLCCDAENFEGLARNIQQFTREKENRQKYGDNARAYYVANFSVDSFIKTFINILTD